jgi:exosome complex RNA-binding protein Csl4
MVVVRKTFDVVWADIVQLFTRNNIQIRNIAKDSGVIYAESSNFGPQVADCGQPGMFVPIARRGSMNVFVQRADDAQMVTVNTEFTETRQMAQTVIQFRCNSTGALERGVLGSIAP